MDVLQSVKDSLDFEVPEWSFSESINMCTHIQSTIRLAKKSKSLHFIVLLDNLMVMVIPHTRPNHIQKASSKEEVGILLKEITEGSIGTRSYESILRTIKKEFQMDSGSREYPNKGIRFSQYFGEAPAMLGKTGNRQVVSMFIADHTILMFKTLY